MIENATNFTNTTIHPLGGILGFLSAILKEMPIVTGLIAVLSLIVGGILMVFKVLSREFKDIKIKYVDDVVTCEYQNSDFLKNPTVRRWIMIWGARGLLKKFEGSIKNCKKEKESFYEHIDHVIADILLRVGDKYTKWKMEGEAPCYYIIPQYVKTVIVEASLDRAGAINSKTYLTCYPDSKGYYLSTKIPPDTDYTIDKKIYHTELTIARGKSKLEVRELMNLIQEQIISFENEDYAMRVLKAAHNMKDPKEAFDKKLAVIVRSVKFWGSEKIT